MEVGLALDNPTLEDHIGILASNPFECTVITFNPINCFRNFVDLLTNGGFSCIVFIPYKHLYSFHVSRNV